MENFVNSSNIKYTGHDQFQALESVLLPGNNRELFLIRNTNLTEHKLEMPRTEMQNMIVLSKINGSRIEENIVCIGETKGQTINIFNMISRKWTFPQSTNSLELERYGQVLKANNGTT